MSEEILRALMQLFALIVKQDEGVQEKEYHFVRQFLNTQLGEDSAGEYLKLFEDFAEIDPGQLGKVSSMRAPSVKDSVRIFSICKKINKTLNREQKVVVLLHLFELLNSAGKFTPQRMNIVNTVAEVFRIPPEVCTSMEYFIRYTDAEKLDRPDILILGGEQQVLLKGQYHFRGALGGSVFFLHVPDVELYFLKHTCDGDVYLNGLPVKKNIPLLFAPGSSLHLPHGKPVYYSDVSARFLRDRNIVPVSFEVHDVSYRFQNGVYGIRNISFEESHGKLIGIMGASGAGKTTLMKVLSGTQKPSEGSVIINGYDLYQDAGQLKGVIGYIPQEDVLIEELTVYRNLWFNARLCFRDMPAKELEEKVERVLKDLDLYAVKDLKVGSPKMNIISGGQRKRLNIALEIIREPSILFLDEPTSGLSSRDSVNVMDLLKELALKGKLIFVNIHQPSSDIYKMFDNVLILDVGGYLVWYGNPIEAVTYFKRLDAQIKSDVGECPVCGNVNAEIIFNILDARVVDEYGRYTEKRKVRPERWAEFFREEMTLPAVKEVTVPPASSLNVPGKVKQFFIYLQRDILSKMSNKQYVWLNVLVSPVLAFILSYIIRYAADPGTNIYIYRENDNIPVYIFMALIVALFLGMIISAEEIYKDRKILERERFLNLGRGSYLLSKIVVLFMISALQAAVFVAIGNSILEIRGMFFFYWLALFTTAACANLLGLIISASFNSPITIYIVVPVLIIPMMVLSGAMFSFDKLNRTVSSVDKVPLIAEMMPTKWTYEALMVHQFKDNKYEQYFYDLEKKESQADFQQVYRIPKLREALNTTITLYNAGKLSRENPGKLVLLRNEIEKENRTNPGVKFDETGRLTPEQFDVNLSVALNNYLDRLASWYNEKLLKANRKKQKILEYMLGTDPARYRRLKDHYYNESLADIVLKVFERNRILEYKDHLIQNYHPIYQDPDTDHWLGIRTHFYAPRKYFAGHFYDTYVFNTYMVWFMILLLYFILYFDIVKKVMYLTGKRLFST